MVSTGRTTKQLVICTSRFAGGRNAFESLVRVLAIRQKRIPGPSADSGQD